MISTKKMSLFSFQISSSRFLQSTIVKNPRSSLAQVCLSSNVQHHNERQLSCLSMNKIATHRGHSSPAQLLYLKSSIFRNPKLPFLNHNANFFVDSRVCSKMDSSPAPGSIIACLICFIFI